MAGGWEGVVTEGAAREAAGSLAVAAAAATGSEVEARLGAFPAEDERAVAKEAVAMAVGAATVEGSAVVA